MWPIFLQSSATLHLYVVSFLLLHLMVCNASYCLVCPQIHCSCLPLGIQQPSNPFCLQSTCRNKWVGHLFGCGLICKPWFLKAAYVLLLILQVLHHQTLRLQQLQSGLLVFFFKKYILNGSKYNLFLFFSFLFFL